jgi:hypothetical protein
VTEPRVHDDRFVRQFALTQGRARSQGADLPLDAIVTVTAACARRLAAEPPSLEQARIAHLAASPLSIAEVAAHLRVHLGIARVLVGDMVADGCLALSTADFDDDGPDLRTLERLLDDLHAL